MCSLEVLLELSQNSIHQVFLEFFQTKWLIFFSHLVNLQNKLEAVNRKIKNYCGIQFSHTIIIIGDKKYTIEAITIIVIVEI